MFCETRWVEKNIVLEDFQKMYCMSHSYNVLKVFGFTSRLSLTLQRSECDILKIFQIIGSIK